MTSRPPQPWLGYVLTLEEATALTRALRKRPAGYDRAAATRRLLTSKNSQELARNLENDPSVRDRMPKPTGPATPQASHLVPTSDQARRITDEAVLKAISAARRIMTKAGIKQNDAVNGFWATTSNQGGTGTNDFFRELGRVMRLAEKKGPDAVRQALRDLRARALDPKNKW